MAVPNKYTEKDKEEHLKRTGGKPLPVITKEEWESMGFTKLTNEERLVVKLLDRFGDENFERIAREEPHRMIAAIPELEREIKKEKGEKA